MAQRKTTPAAATPAEPTEPKATPAVEAPAATEPPKGARKVAVKTPCMCGCDTEVGGKFAPGHDARFASALVTAVEFGHLSADVAIAAAGLVSEAFERKVRHGIDRLTPGRADAIRQTVAQVKRLADHAKARKVTG